MKALPHVSSQIDEKLIFKVIKENYAHIAPSFYSFISNWLIRAYQRYNQIDKFIIIIYLIHNNLKFYRKNGLIFNFETFYKDRTIEIEKINISDISKDLNIPKESVRRKIIELEKNKIIQKFGKKIFVDKSTFQASKATESVKDLSNVFYEFNLLLKARYPILYISSLEEDRIEYTIRKCVKKLGNKAIYTWDFVDGYINNPNNKGFAAKNPLQALELVEKLVSLGIPRKQVFVTGHSCGGLTTLMFFAIMTHIRVGSRPKKALPSVALFSLCIFLLFG